MLNKREIKGLVLSSVLASASVWAGGMHGDSHGGHANGRHQEHGGHAEMQGHGDSHGKGDHGHGNEQAHAQSAVGRPGDASKVNRTINVELLDSMRFVFNPDVKIAPDDVVRFVVTNKGSIRHEFSVGNESEQVSHRKMMAKMPDMVHEDGNSVTVEPGQTRELVWAFVGDPDVVFACNIPGHSEAGMMARVRVGG